MLVREVMTTQVVTVRPDTTAKEAIQRLSASSITSMPVVDRTGELVGVVSEADVLRDSLLPEPRVHATPVVLGGRPLPLAVADLMSHLPLTVGPDDDLARAAGLLVETQVKSLPVLDHGRVVGMVSRRDIIKVLARQDLLIEAEIDELLRSSDFECTVVVVDGVVWLEAPSEPHVREIVRVLASGVPGVVAVTFEDRGGALAGSA